MLTLRNNPNETNMPGVYVNPATIINAVDVSNKPLYDNDDASARDLALEVEFDIGKSWTKKVIIKGNFNYNDDETDIIDWGSAFVVKELFMRTGCFADLSREEISNRLQIFSQKQIPVDFLQQLIGKSVLTVDYVKGISEEGKLRYGTWNLIGTNREKLMDEFRESLTKGFPWNYKPELLNNARAESAISDMHEYKMAANADFDF